MAWRCLRSVAPVARRFARGALITPARWAGRSLEQSLTRSGHKLLIIGSGALLYQLSTSRMVAETDTVASLKSRAEKMYGSDPEVSMR